MKHTAKVLRLTVTLLAICAIVAAALAGVNALTEPVIAQRNAEKTQAAIEKVLPGGGTLLESFPNEKGIIQAVYASEKGYAIEVTPAGFGGPITMMVGVSGGRVTAIDIISHTETPSLGAVAGADNAQGKAFRGQFSGLSGILKVTRDGGHIDAITSATITSRAVTEGVNAALACAAALG